MALFQGIITRIFKQGNNAEGVPFRATNLSSLSVAQIEAPYLEATRSGRRMHGGLQLLSSGIAPVAAIPTTLSQLVLFNNDTNSNGLALCLDWLNMFLASGTPAAGATIMVTVARPVVPPTQNATNYASVALSGTANGSKALWAINLSMPTGTVWTALSSSLQPAAANLGQGDNPIDLGGRIVIPPGYGLGIAILSGAGTTPLYAVHAQWSEFELDLA